jgi:hypothetical protein
LTDACIKYGWHAPGILWTMHTWLDICNPEYVFVITLHHGYLTLPPRK